MKHMETCKFVEEFTRVTNGEFGMLKFCGATYYKATAQLTVRFLISAFDYKSFMDDPEAQKRVESAVAGLFGGLKTSVQYIKTYADDAVVRNKTLEFFNANNSMLFKRLNPSNLIITTSDDIIKIELRFDAAICKMLNTGNLLEGLKSALERAFMQRIDVSTVECELDKNAEEEYFKSTTVQSGASLRLVEIKLGEKLYARSKIENINQMPNYIIDIKSAGENIVLCGKVSGLTRRKFKNKRYDPNDKKSGPEELPLLSFFIDDTTGKMETVCFPKAEEADKLEEKLRDGTEVTCIGKVATSNFSGMFNYTVNAIFSCEIVYDSIHAMERKPIPERYECVRPTPYKTVREQGFLDDGMATVDEYMADKAFVVFDLETTSTDVPTTEIIEIGALRIEKGEITAFSTLVKPSGHIPEGASKVNHITDDLVAFAPSIDKVLPDFYKFTAEATLVGHNAAGFDVPIVRRIGAEKGYYFDNDVEDTLQLARQYIPEKKGGYSLESLAKEFGYTHSQAHRALSDVEATYELFREILRRRLQKRR